MQKMFRLCRYNCSICPINTFSFLKLYLLYLGFPNTKQCLLWLTPSDIT